MAQRKTKSSTSAIERTESPARSAEEQENRMISLAVALAEDQLRNGTASAQVITHYLKLGSSRERLEQENKELENQLLAAKTEAIKSAERVEELYAQAIEAMQSYAGSAQP